MNTDELTRTIKERFDYESANQVLKEKYEAKMLFALDGGMWCANPELIALLSTFNDDMIVLKDTYNNPCQVNREALLYNAKERFQEQMNAWLHEYTEVSRQR
jgi:hypothetical protein